ncbi:MAG: hypothetical protein ACM3PA_02275 [Methanomassiliicoccales archaeon]
MNTNLNPGAKLNLVGNLILGALLLVCGIVFTIQDINLLPNNKALIGISFIPLAMAFSQWLNIFMIKKYPQEMSPSIIASHDERLVLIRNAAEAQTQRIIRWLLNLVFIGYTLMVPAHIFETVSWWAVVFFWALSYALPVLFLQLGNRKEGNDE